MAATEQFEFRRLPKEIRELVYPHELSVDHDNKPSALFVAVAADPTLLAEALPIYHQVNYVLTKGNMEHFKKMPLKKVMKVKHLKIVFGQDDEEFNPFRANKAILMNNIRTITLDFSGVAPLAFNHLPSSSVYWEQVVHAYVNASSGVEKVVMKLGWDCSDDKSEPVYPVTYLNQRFGMEAKLKDIFEDVDGTYMRFGIWTWEAEIGDSFKSNKFWGRTPRQAS